MVDGDEMIAAAGGVGSAVGRFGGLLAQAMRRRERDGGTPEDILPGLFGAGRRGKKLECDVAVECFDSLCCRTAVVVRTAGLADGGEQNLAERSC